MVNSTVSAADVRVWNDGMVEKSELRGMTEKLYVAYFMALCHN